MLQPLSDRVILKVNKEQEESVGGIVLSAAAKDQPQIAVVVEVGPGLVTESGKLIPMEVAKGDTVIFDKFAGSEIKEGNEKYLVLHEKDIYAIVK